ncbi:MAG: radical SAM protein [Planctomycetes bacterium]|nr:radical SAM protein [Planctomycetota bacterium]
MADHPPSRPGVNRRFLRVKLDLSNQCQLRCVMCHFAHPEFVANPTQMDRALLEKVAAETFPLAHEVVPSSSAEPLLSRELPRALELCREYEVPFFHFSTNGVSLNDRIIDKVLETGMPSITFSIDSHVPETFESIRTPARLAKILEKLDRMIRCREENPARLPKISVTAVIMRKNIEEMPDFIRFMHSRGVDALNFVHMGVIGGLGIEDETLLKHPAVCNRMLRRMRAVADELGTDAQMPGPIPEHLSGGADATDAPDAAAGGGTALLPAGATLSSAEVADFLNQKNREFNLAVKPKQHHTRPCYFPWFYIHINPDGTVFPCGCWFEFTGFGDFRTQSFREIWTGPKYRELRRQLVHLELRPVCANCSVSNMGRPDVLASFSHRARIRKDQLRREAQSSAGGGNAEPTGRQP